MKKVFRIVTNKFLLTGVAFAVWMVFFDQNNWSSQKARRQQLANTEQNITYLNEEIVRMEKEHYDLTHDPEKLERYARERYKMKRDNEDLYIVE